MVVRLPAAVIAAVVFSAMPALSAISLGSDDDAPRAAAPRIDSRSRWEQRLLTLNGGLVLRGKARLLGEAWELKSGAEGVRSVPALAVVADRTVTDAKAEVITRRRDVLRAKAGERVPLAEWMLSVGLYTEALAELSDALDEQPDCPEVLALLARDGLPLAVPAVDLSTGEGQAVLLDYGARSPASLQELTILALDETPLKARRDLLTSLESGLSSKEPVRREFSARALRRLFAGSAVRPLTVRTILDSSDDVRREAALALRDTGEESVIEPLARALESEHSTVRTHAAEALGMTGFAAAVEPLALRLSTLAPTGGGGSLAPRGTIFVGRQISYVQDYDAEIATNATIADPIIGVVQEGVTLDARIFGVSGNIGYAYTHETKSIRRALGGLTGLKVNDTNPAWKRWWRTEGASWLAENIPATAVSQVGAEDGDAG